MREQDVQRSILEYLKLRQIYCWKQSTGGIKKSNGSYIPAALLGVSDIIGILNDGRFLAIEVKRPGGSASLFQKSFLDSISRRGGLAFIATSIDDVIAKGI